MKVLAFADSHDEGNYYEVLKKKAKKADIILCAGDFTVFEHNMKKIIRDLSKLGKTVYLIHGNHEIASHVAVECKKYKNIRFMHKKIFRIGEVTIFGYGGGGFSYRDKDFEEFIKRNKDKFSKKNILLTHAPPYGTVADNKHGEHVGNKSITKVLKHFNLSISGHIHETFNKREVINKKTLVINPGPKGKVIKI